MLDYAAGPSNYSHFATGPLLEDGEARSDKTLIDEPVATHVSLPEIGKQVADAILEVGTRGLIVTPGMFSTNGHTRAKSSNY